MPSKPPTAVEELHERVATLENQIERALYRAAEAQGLATMENELAIQMGLLCTQYKDILKVIAGRES